MPLAPTRRPSAAAGQIVIELQVWREPSHRTKRLQRCLERRTEAKLGPPTDWDERPASTYRVARNGKQGQTENRPDRSLPHGISHCWFK